MTTESHRFVILLDLNMPRLDGRGSMVAMRGMGDCWIDLVRLPKSSGAAG